MDPQTRGCIVAASYSLGEAVDNANYAFHDKVDDERDDYYFDAVRVDVKQFREGLFGHRAQYIVSLWYDRIPRPVKTTTDAGTTAGQPIRG